MEESVEGNLIFEGNKYYSKSLFKVLYTELSSAERWQAGFITKRNFQTIRTFQKRVYQKVTNAQLFFYAYGALTCEKEFCNSELMYFWW